MSRRLIHKRGMSAFGVEVRGELCCLPLNQRAWRRSNWQQFCALVKS